MKIQYLPHQAGELPMEWRQEKCSNISGFRDATSRNPVDACRRRRLSISSGAGALWLVRDTAPGFPPRNARMAATFPQDLTKVSMTAMMPLCLVAIFGLLLCA